MDIEVRRTEALTSNINTISECPTYTEPGGRWTIAIAQKKPTTTTIGKQERPWRK